MKAHVISVRNVNSALSEGLHWLAVAGIEMDSRNGPVLKAPGPVITEFRQPCERVLFSALRDANPFFHLYECIWMLAGRNDSATVANYAKHMDTFAENGVMNGAYGHRWRTHFGYDQLLFVAEELRRDPMTRRAVLTMWDPGSSAYEGMDDTFNAGDAHKARAGSKDVPCNTQVYFDATSGSLDMTVCNRSNDVVWGAYGANAVHMSFLQEVIAAALGIPVGAYYQVSNNFHVYTEREDVQRLLQRRRDVGEACGGNDGWNVLVNVEDRYRDLEYFPVRHSYGHLYEPGGANLVEFLLECELLAAHPASGYAPVHPFLRDVFRPMMLAHYAYKQDQLEAALACARTILAPDWRVACVLWLQRRADKRKAANHG